MTDTQKHGDILIVDDERMNLMVLKGVLGQAGFAVRCASSGPEALDMARSQKPGLILLDIMMPGESGLETCRKLKADPLTAHVPVIFVSCLGEMADKLAGLDRGAVDYITKPFNAQEVVARVRSHLNFQQVQGAVINAQASRLGQVSAAQRALLPRPESLPGARFAVEFLPVLEAGGDFYDVAELGQNQTAYLVADVSGHDLGASFITSSLKALFRQHAVAGRSPAEVLAGMNSILCAITPEEVYLTALCLVLDRGLGAYSLSSAGHPPALAQLGGVVNHLELKGLPMGLFEEADYGLAQGPARAGDRFYLYTDGLAENAGLYVTSSAFTSALEAACLHSSVLPLDSAVQAMLRDLTGEGRPVDDVLLLGVEA